MNLIKSITEEELLKGCRKKETWAQRRLYDRYSSVMLGVCIRYMKDRPEAEDRMVEGFMKVFNGINKFRGEGSFEGWIRRIMINECLMFIRKNKSLYLEIELGRAENDPSLELLEDTLEAEELLEMIQALPSGYRTIFNLYAIEGYSHAEIAKQLNISVNTSKSQLSRARALLQKRLLEIEKQLNEKIIGDE